MFPQTTTERPEKTVPFTANAKERIGLQRSGILRALHLALIATPTIAGASNTAANTMRGDEFGVLKNVSIVANGNNYLQTWSGAELRMLNWLWYGAPPMPVAAIGDGATANPPIDTVLPFPLVTPDSAKPFDTCLDLRKYGRIELEVEWGQYTDINSAASAWTATPVLTVHRHEAFGLPPDVVFDVRRNFTIQEAFSAANSAAAVNLPTGSRYNYRGFLIDARNDDATPLDTAAVISNLKLYSGPRVFFDQPFDVAQRISYAQRRLATGWDFGSYAQQRFTRNTKEHQNAWLLLDLVKDGYMTETLDTSAFADLILELNITEGSTVRIQPIVIDKGQG